ncbi:DUF4055 domain-containing protein [Acinetobacter baumannii]|uniref:DUF4055 domain-containing protein n=1 Tax=Acinetobacter baumannii TaxID=470 RepID=UPI0002BB69E3|nr:DUF4055 domain-containing protein [Acinetobacter baumannii]AGH35036.1 hypothetical protein ABD1_11480 [Acinetobacter baumannii D1279779]EHZ6732278.1 DUF4055 domain-containing protein [Acinetobacter baumannii]EKT8703004.1 DUF4055 domain-containing protein [Acinetobacter baumannii]EKT9844677.1 DUF4055 domain-containing protein [Acinetobacter baumannii]EKT9848216.1 DUF4055 domain-containing protein [Acinetobacter baumannii]
MSDVTFKHAEYVKNVGLWQKIDDVCDGEDAVKEQREKYLPKPNAHDKTPENDAAYAAYLTRAVFYEVTGTTLNSLVGAAFATDPSFKFTPELEHLERNANGAGLSAYQLAQTGIRHLLKHYRCALYVDYPDVIPARNLKEHKEQNSYPMIHLLNAVDVINWDSMMVGNQKKLCLVVIREVVSTRGSDGFSKEDREQFRVLRLEPDENGEFAYSVQIYTKNDKGKYEGGPKKFPTDHSGRTWSYIPFTFVGAVDNSEEIKKPPLLALANLNLAHYRDSADFQESVFYMGQPQYYVSGVNWQWFDEAKARGIYVGAKVLLPLPENGKLGIEQANPNTLSREAMKDKWNQMKELGARLIEKGSAAKTATEANNDDAVQHSVLSLCVVNMNEALSMALRWCAKYVIANVDALNKDDLMFEISQEFNKQGYLAELARQLFEAALQGRSSFKSWWEYNQTGMFPKQKYEDELQNVEAEQDGTLNQR